MKEDRAGVMNPDFWRLVDALAPLCGDIATREMQRNANPTAWKIRGLVAELCALAELPAETREVLGKLAPASEDLVVDQDQVGERAEQIAESLCYQWYAVLCTTARSESKLRLSPLIPRPSEILQNVCLSYGLNFFEAERLIRKAFNAIIPVFDALALPGFPRSEQLLVERIAENEYRIHHGS